MPEAHSSAQNASLDADDGRSRWKRTMGTYRGDLINTGDPLAPFIQPER